MAKNFVQVGDIIEVVAPSGGCTSGNGYVIGQIFGVALTSVASGSPVNWGVAGVWALPKVTTVQFTAGTKVWWDPAGSGTVTTTGTTTQVHIGLVASTAVTTAAIVNVLLTKTPAPSAT